MALFEVEVVYALPDQQWLHLVSVTEGCTAAQAIALSGLAAHWRAGVEEPQPLTRFGRLISADTVLSAGDRVEILRPLSADPKDQRRQRAKTAARARRAVARQ